MDAVISQYFDNLDLKQQQAAMLTLAQTFLTDAQIDRRAEVLDLGCGNGHLALSLAEDGWKVTGVDFSPIMLHTAKTRSEQDGRLVTWINADLRRFEKRPPAGVAFAVEVVNHMADPQDLAAFLKSAFRSLKPGAWLVFDTNTAAYYQSAIWNYQGREIQGDQYRAKLTSAFMPDTQLVVVETEAQIETENGPMPLKNQLIARFYPDVAIEFALSQAGFVNVSHQPIAPVDLTHLDPALTTTKHWWQAQKRS